MRRTLRFLGVLVALLLVLTVAASSLVTNATRKWFEKDMRLRAQLAVNGAGASLAAHWRAASVVALRKVLTDLTRDERIMAAAACSHTFQLLAQTDAYPEEFDCGSLGRNLDSALSELNDKSEVWGEIAQTTRGELHLSAVPMVGQETARGFVVLVQDMTFVARRDAATQGFLFLAFGVLAIAASAMTFIAGRLSSRRFMDEFRRFVRGDANQPEFQPLLHDVRELVERLVAERDAETQEGIWSPQRLKRTLSRHLEGERVVIVANREPYIHERTKSGQIIVMHPASGLVTALEPVARACSGVWIAHGSGSADWESADNHGRIKVPPGEESYVVRRVKLSDEEQQGYYYGFSNEGLWPLCHVAHARPVFKSADWRFYQSVNAKFADAVCTEVDIDDPIVLVQDYHFALAPRLIRERLPRATIISFWHIPWPNAERFGICPWATELLEGMLGGSIVGFHTQLHCNNFLDSVDRFLEARIDRAENAIIQFGRKTLVRPYPISLEWPVRWVASAPAHADCRAAVGQELGIAKECLLGVGVDRLDYTKGVEERLLAVGRLLEKHPEFAGRFVFVQIAAPSRTKIDRYRELNDSVEKIAASVNGCFGQGDYRPIILLRAHHEPPAVFRYYRAADVCYVSSLHDGMNLVAKEFVAARDDERGVLVLSKFTGAARELTEALIVNPYDLDDSAEALATALKMPAEEQQARMRAMRGYVAEFNVYRWAGRMLVDASRLRRRDRLTGRLTDRIVEAEPTE